jgi:hypothetical protein
LIHGAVFSSGSKHGRKFIIRHRFIPD